MNASGEKLDALAQVLAYPEEGYAGRLDRCAALLAADAPEEARRCIARFRERLGTADVGELQEEYTRTFDLDPSCSLEVGWHLFGENYSRGEFLVEMRRALRGLELEEAGELPDHLVHVLPVLARMDPVSARTFIGERVLPALDKMLAALEGKDQRYEDLLRAVRSTVLDLGGVTPMEV